MSTEEDDGPVRLYLEAHITIEPVFDERRGQAARIASAHNFKLAELLMHKERKVSAERSDKDTFMTGHSRYRSDLFDRTRNLVSRLQEAGFQVWRYKIEDTLLDSRTNDVWNLL